MTLTATADAEAPLVPPAEPAVVVAAPAVAERPVFAAVTPARPRALKLTGRVVAGLVGLWLVALVLGTFGFGPVAGIGLPRIGGKAKPQREAVHKSPVTHAGERVTRSGVTLTTRYGGATAAPATTRRGTGPTGTSRRAATRQAPGSHSGGTGGGNGGSSSGGGASPGGGNTTGGNTGHAPTTTSGGATNTTPTTSTTTTTTNPHANSTHSQATPPGSSSSAPGSRSNAGTAPGREQSASTPTPGSGRSEHAPPKG
jgi:hypothetical protein